MGIRYRNRLTVVAPVGNLNAINQKIRQKIDPDGGSYTMGQGLGLSSNGSGSPSYDWFSTVYTDAQLPIWTGILGNYGVGSVKNWTWNMYGGNDHLLPYWSGYSNVTVTGITPDEVLALLGLKRIQRF